MHTQSGFFSPFRDRSRWACPGATFFHSKTRGSGLGWYRGRGSSFSRSLQNEAGAVYREELQVRDQFVLVTKVRQESRDNKILVRLVRRARLAPAELAVALLEPAVVDHTPVYA